ncbi:methylated-DNA--protein-cysteine methyltransferase [Halogeometricum borinquense DSM 11551]|uniref:Methylated DNA-protein cysteine methyltransferase n=1 Tax=Halogeometricum borinquense (strain ATCC 700274 / DSM 11551 / JCM 10706 / KCTC 4070 / PR3) TaxID=469382 RepID=E4NRE8_HALBP|nr:MGMT family protein [Halogeometricum borinquense]ADQ67989.1 methylated DNA-protein cysteine methyltransferase [Halogeometricum borinquense DSM 11551]ELY24090.1 methylated-DNA--protein-cysteine methyltransferase [Halogeometricum borinquense DSM 11551]
MNAGVFARESDRLGRAVQIGVASGSIISVSFPESAPADAESEHPILDRVFAYLDGDEDHFDDAPVALTVPTDHRRVLDAVRNIPYGETIALRRVIRMAGMDPEDEDDVATARSALRENPVPLFIPDHRVDDAPGAIPEAVARRLRQVESA